MTDYAVLMALLSRPRPNGSRAERETAQALCAWLEERNIPFTIQEFRLYPYYFEAIGLWLIVSRSLLAWAIWAQRGWLALVIALIGLVGATFDVAFHIPIVTWPGARTGLNILIGFGPSAQATRQELVISAHYDSKTELMDHAQRMFFLRNLPTGIILTALAGLFSPAALLLRQSGNIQAAGTLHAAESIAAFIVLILALGYGLNLSLGRFIKPSQGAVDNGAACAILLGLAEQIQSSRLTEPGSGLPPDLKLTLALFAGEEVDRQGSRAFVQWRGRSKTENSAKGGIAGQKMIALNLEVMAQNGDYVYWEREGSVFGLRPTSPEINHSLIQAVEKATGSSPKPAGPITSDGASFLEASIPTVVLGTLDRHWDLRGFHRPSDHLDRVVMERLPEGVQILQYFIDAVVERSKNI